MAGQLVQVATETVSSAVASVTLTGINDDSVYMVAVSNFINATDNKNVQLQVTVSGTADSTANYDFAYKQLRADTTFSNTAGVNYSVGVLPILSTGNVGGEGATAIFYLYNFNNSSEYSFATVETNFIDFNGNLKGMQGGFVHTVAQSCDGVKFTLESSSNIQSGTFTLYKVI
tara:strand:- start:14 stop:532 length:519 start_codon:yes stop_codon:yes gene_type:complete